MSSLEADADALILGLQIASWEQQWKKKVQLLTVAPLIVEAVHKPLQTPMEVRNFCFEPGK